MKISYDWLKQYIAVPESPEELGKILTSTGLEVESITPFGSIKGGLKGVVVGEVVNCVRHPNADKLSLTQVDVGAERPLSIVCGAPNVAAGQKVVVALIGTTLYPVKGEPFTIKAAKIRGEQSEGMICAEDEIGLGENHAGIIVLNQHGPVNLKNGTPAAQYFNISDDATIEIGLTPNRADAASHLGVARDLKAARSREITMPSIDSFPAGDNSLLIPVSVESEGCIRYSSVTLTGVTVKESPDWLKNRLRSIGLSPINNIVDITNFVLHELGQPLHAFDADQITGGKVIVKTVPAGTHFLTLDNKDRTLTGDDLMICNSVEGMCIAGVMGGLKSGISNGTRRVFLESACFSAAYVRKTSMHHQLKSDASFRFERGTDPNMTVYALKRAALLIMELAGGAVTSPVSDVNPHPVVNQIVRMSDKNIARLIGKVIPRAEVTRILSSLDITLVDSSADSFTVSIPPYRVDVLKEADVIEEILRIYGFNNIELASASGTAFISDFPTKDVNTFRRSLGEQLVASGFYEIMTNSLTNALYASRHQLKFRGQPVEILNKLSEEQGVLRQTMLFSGLEVCAHNINRKQRDLKFYEFGKIYWKEPTETSPYKEEERLALFVTGNLESENWQRKSQAVSYFDLAQYVSALLQKCVGFEGFGTASASQERLDDSIFEYGTKILSGSLELGRIGKVRSTLVRDFSIKQEIFYGDLNAALLFKIASPKFEVQEVPKFPEVRRDLSLVLDKRVTFSEIQELVLATEKRLIREIIAFDVYEGDKIPEGKKAYALGFTLLDENKTLTDEEIDKTMSRLINAFEQRMGALIRK